MSIVAAAAAAAAAGKKKERKKERGGGARTSREECLSSLFVARKDTHFVKYPMAEARGLTLGKLRKRKIEHSLV